MGRWKVKLTSDYVGGIVAGIGMGLAFCPLLLRFISADPRWLSWLGVMLAIGGAFFVRWTQGRGVPKGTVIRQPARIP